MISVKEAEQRILSNIQIVGECWEWQGTFQKGYGQINLKNLEGFDSYRTKFLTHRIMYLARYGTLPQNLSVCHKCDNTLCCNPDHLFIGSHDDNMKDRAAKGGFLNQKGNNWSSISVLADWVEYPSYVSAGAALGVSDNAIKKRIKNGWDGYKVIGKTYTGK